MVAVMKKKPKTEQTSVPCPRDVRQLAEEVKNAGNYGSVTNTLRTSLREQLERIRQQKSAQQQPPQSS